MKVLQICADAGSGSIGRIAEDLYYGLKENGDECIIAYGRRKHTTIPDENLIQIGNSTQVYMHALHTRIFDRTGMGICSRNATIHFVKEIEKYNPDIIHMHGNYGYYINIEVLFHYLSRKNITVQDIAVILLIRIVINGKRDVTNALKKNHIQQVICLIIRNRIIFLKRNFLLL